MDQISKVRSKKGKIWALNASRMQKVRVRCRRLDPKDSLREKPVSKPNHKFKQGWREFGGRKVFFRSKWEANFGRYLQWQKERKEIQDWHHEPQTFWFDGIRRGCVSYLPDFKVIHPDGSHEWIEVKGFMDAKSRTKISRFRKYFPKEKLRVVDAAWYKKNCKNLSLIIPGWEKG